MRRWAAASVAALALAWPLAGQAQQPGRPVQARPAPADSAPPAAASPAEDFSVAIIDIPAILRQSTAAQELQRQMQAEQEKYRALADEQQNQLQREEEGIERERSSLSSETYTQKRRAFQDRVNHTTSEFRDRRRLIDEAFNNASGEINRTLLGVIDELARRQGIQLVVRREAVLYQRAVLDLTSAAGQTLNERLPVVKVVLPPPAQ